jgi:hypothetical protein
MNDAAKRTYGEIAIIRTVMPVAALLVLIAAATSPSFSQSNPGLQTFSRQDIGLSQDQIAAIQSGEPIAKTMPSGEPVEVFLFGAVYIHAAPEKYLQFARDFDRMRKPPNYLALGVFSNPPKLSDLKGFSFDSEDIQALKSCKPGDCLIQMPASSIEELQRTINWSAADADEQVSQLLQKTALQRLVAYQQEGNQVLGTTETERGYALRDFISRGDAPVEWVESKSEEQGGSIVAYGQN